MRKCDHCKKNKATIEWNAGWMYKEDYMICDACYKLSRSLKRIMKNEGLLK